MALGNLGEHRELTALRSAGIPILRILWPLCAFVLVLTGLAFFSNSYVVPRANLNALSLLSDLVKKKPSVAIKEGLFYDGVPGYSIKVNKKLEDKTKLEGIMIYDHTEKRGNVSLTMAKSGRIYTIKDEAYLVIELFDGHNYLEEARKELTAANPTPRAPYYVRTAFKSQKLVISLDSLKLSRTKKERSYRSKNTQQLAAHVVSMRKKVVEAKALVSAYAIPFWAVPNQPKVAVTVRGKKTQRSQYFAV